MNAVLVDLVETLEAVRGTLRAPQSAQSGVRVRQIPDSRPPASIAVLSWLDEVGRTVARWYDQATGRPRPPARTLVEQTFAMVATLDGHELPDGLEGLVVEGRALSGLYLAPRPIGVSCPTCGTTMVLSSGEWPRCPTCRVTRTDVEWLGRVVTS